MWNTSLFSWSGHQSIEAKAGSASTV
jgi:hypothetical protein